MIRLIGFNDSAGWSVLPSSITTRGRGDDGDKQLAALIQLFLSRWLTEALTSQFYVLPFKKYIAIGNFFSPNASRKFAAGIREDCTKGTRRRCAMATPGSLGKRGGDALMENGVVELPPFSPNNVGSENDGYAKQRSPVIHCHQCQPAGIPPADQPVIEPVYFPTMLHLLTFAFSNHIIRTGVAILLSVSQLTACQKSGNTDPCVGVLNEGTPEMVGLRFGPANRGDILVRDSLEAMDVQIRSGQNGDSLLVGDLIRDPSSPYYGRLFLYARDGQECPFRYSIQLPDGGTFQLSHRNTREFSADNCRRSIIRIGDPVVDGYPAAVMRAGSRILVDVAL